MSAVATLQTQLTGLYELDLAFQVEHFLFSDARVARALEGPAWRPGSEKLLVRESSGELELSVYLDAALLARLETAPLDLRSATSLDDWWTAIEGVSHFLYLAWNARHDRGVRAVELELQAEVDKYVMTTQLASARQDAAVDAVHALLFECARPDPALAGELRVRYHDASRSAAQYCLSLARRFGTGPHPDLVRELRRFYRLDHATKLRFIAQH